MSPVTARMHALLARELIAACGGLDEAAGACRLKKSRLGECQDPESGACLPIDVVAELEAYCRRPIYSRAVAESCPALASGRTLVEEVSDATEECAGLQHLVRQLQAKKRPLTPREKLAIDLMVLKIEDELRDVSATLEAGGEP